jgi:predicted CoA-substrate-specific enzyme activase
MTQKKYLTNPVYILYKLFMIYTLGIDIGSTTSKCVILEEGSRIAGEALVAAGTGTKGPEQALQAAYKAAALSSADISYTVATGYGRMSYTGADEQKSELSCHALGAHWIFPDVRTVIDIGGQDAKALRVNEKGELLNFVMNDKCAAGTGRFLEMMARVLQLEISALEVEAAKSKAPAKISNTCTVFAESEVISQLASGEGIPNIVAGICDAVASRVGALVHRVGVEPQVCMTGGVARNGGVRAAMERVLGEGIKFSPQAQFTGALGAALFAFRAT